MKKLLTFSVAVFLASGCASNTVSRYAIAVDNTVALRSLNGKTLNVGAFSSTTPGQKDILCWGIEPVNTPDGEPFANFVQKAFVDELKIANIYSSSAKVTITGNLDSIDFSSVNGAWNLSLTVKSSNGKSMAVTESYAYSSGVYSATVCKQAAQAFMPAVQNLVGKVVRSPEFSALVAP